MMYLQELEAQCARWVLTSLIAGGPVVSHVCWMARWDALRGRYLGRRNMCISSQPQDIKRSRIFLLSPAW